MCQKRTLKWCVIVIGLSVLPLLTTDRSTAAADAADGNLLKPIAKAESWRFEQHEDGKGILQVQEDTLVLKVTKTDGVDWHVQVFQTNLPLKDGKAYIVAFKAKADAKREMVVQAGIDMEDWHMIGLDEHVDVPVEWKTFEFKFTAENVADNGKNRLGFVLGMEKGTIYVKDLILKPA